MKVRFFDPGRKYMGLREEMLPVIDGVLKRGDLILREDMEQFEEQLAHYVGKKHAVAVNSGTDALYLTLWALGIGKGDEVIVPSHTFVATAQVVHQLGAMPIVVDVHDDLLMHGIDVVDYITDKTKAIIPVHLTGAVADISELQSSKYHIIEDAAQALGAHGVGYGLAQSWSFYPAKILGAYGDAGAITTDDEKLADELRQLRHHYKRDYSKWGINSRMDNLQAAILNVKLKHITDSIMRRYDIAEFYKEHLAGLPLRLPEYSEGRVWQDYVIRCRSKEEREQLYEYLKTECEVETMRNDYPMPIPKTPNAQKIEDETLRIPCNDVLSDEEITHVANSIKKFYGTTA